MMGEQGELMPGLPIPEAGLADNAEKPAGRARYQEAMRNQIELRPCDLDALLGRDHKARLVWDFVQGLDLSVLYAGIRAVEGGSGRPPIDPAILMTLWLYATLEGVGSARELARLSEREDAYRWICGGVGVNHHTLSEFRVGQVEFLDAQLSASVAALVSGGLVSLNRVAQDGMRIRARVEAARRRAAEEREARIQAALAMMPEIERHKAKRRRKRSDDEPPDQRQAREKREAARVSSTDPEARVMKMADGGFRPAYNAQLSTDTASQVITGVALINVGSDLNQLGPMAEQHQARYGRLAAEWLVDGGFAKHEQIQTLADWGVTTYAPVPTPKDGERDRHRPRPGDAPAVAEWRERMGTAHAQAIYKERAATAECVNAQMRNRGLWQFNVRGLLKAKAVLLWYALAHNLMRAVALRKQAEVAA